MKLFKYTLAVLSLILLRLESTAQCSASYTDSVSGLTLILTSTSTATPAITSYLWSFGDGNTSTLPSPTHTYATAGHYNVVLTISNGTCTDSVYKYTMIGCPLSADFTRTSYLGTGYFTNMSTGISPSTNYLWRFGDGSTSTLQNPSHPYSSFGTYNATLVISQAACIDSISKSINVCALAGSWFNYSISGTNVTFNSAITGTSASTRYLWNFGDGDTSTSINPSHTYSSPGTYNVHLIARDSNCIDSITRSVTVFTCPVTSSFAYTNSGLTTFFTFTGSALTGTTSYSWNFGDGDTSSLVNPTHSYLSPGNYSVCLIVTDTSGCSDTMCTNISICTITASFFDSVVGLSVTFRSTSTGASTTTAYNWNFGDGNTGTGNPVTHTYSSQGLYSVSLLLNDSGCMDSLSKLVVVSSNVFTPNGDGLDDIFNLPCGSLGAMIYNRLGVLVKTITAGTTTWDGSNNAGGGEPTGQYYIICTGSSSPVPVTLIR